MELWPPCWELVQSALEKYNSSPQRLTRPYRISDLVNAALRDYLVLGAAGSQGRVPGGQGSESHTTFISSPRGSKRRVNLMLAPGIHKSLESHLRSEREAGPGGSTATELVNRALLQFLDGSGTLARVL